MPDIAMQGKKIQSGKEKNYSGKLNIRSMNIEKLDQEKDNVNQLYGGILGISELRWTGIASFIILQQTNKYNVFNSFV